MSEAELAPPPAPPAPNGAPPPPGPALDSPAPPSAPLPEYLVTRLVQFALRTEAGAALWEGYASALAEQHPWVTGRVAFRPGAGVVTPAPPEDRRPQ